MNEKRTNKRIMAYRRHYFEVCAPQGKRCETCTDFCLCPCPVTPLPSTYDELSSVWRPYPSDPNMPSGYFDSSTRGWYRYGKDENGKTRYIKAKKSTKDYTWCERDPDYVNGFRDDNRGPGWYTLKDKKQRSGYWNMRKCKLDEKS